MKKLLAILLVVAVCLTMLTVVFVRQGAGTNAEPAAKSNAPKRIISLSPNLTEIIFALGLGDRVTAVSNDCDWPAEAKQKPKVGSFWQPNTEVIIAAKPDLVICESFPQQKAVAETLERAGVNVKSLRVESIGELYSAITEIGRATGCVEASQRLADEIKAKLDQIRSSCSTAPKVRVLWVIQTEPMRVAGVKTFINELIELAGGQNAIAPTLDQYPSIPTEGILTCGADVIIQSAMGTRDIGEQQASAEKFWSRFGNLPAVKDKRIYVVDPDTLLRLGPRLPQGAKTVAQCLHPELFTQSQDEKQEAKVTDG